MATHSEGKGHESQIKQRAASETHENQHSTTHSDKAHHEATHNEESKKSGKATAQDAGNDSNALPDFAALIETLQGDLAQLDSEAAIAAIDEWQPVLKSSKDEALKEISKELTELKRLLKAKKPDGHHLADLLTRLGEQTTEVAAEAQRGHKGDLQKVGKLLSRAGKTVEKTEVANDDEVASTPDIDALLEALQGNLAELDPGAAITAIDAWHDFLKRSKDDHLQEIAKGLTELKRLVKHNKPDPAKIAESLTHLGEQTTEAATEAERGTKGNLQTLGKLLNKAGKAIS